MKKKRIKKSKINTNNLLEYIKKSKTFSSIIKSVNNNYELLSFLIYHTSFLTNDTTISKRMYYIKHNLNKLELCYICNINEKNWSSNCMYKHTCKNKECIKLYRREHLDPEIEKIRVEKIKLSKSKITQEEKNISNKKRKETNILKYGKESYAQTDQFKNHMFNTYGYISPFELKETHDKSKLTIIENYGVDHNFKIPEVKENKKRTFINNYGFNTPSENEEIKQKIINTNNKKYGYNSPLQNKEIKLKSIQTLQNNYGVDSPLVNKDLLAKFKKTMYDRYGYEHWLQNDENKQYLLLKSFQYREFLFNNKTIYLQGYEDYVLYEILLKLYEQNDIFINTSDITNEIGEIFYIDKNGINRKYYPDFYIKSINKIIEVKSAYIYNLHLETNILKQQKCLSLNINFEFLIIDKKLVRDWRNKQIKQ